MELNEVISIVVAVLLVIVTRYLVPLLREKLEKEGQESLIELIEELVQAAEQIYVGIKMGEKRKEYVEDVLISEGYVIDKSVDACIESAVYRLNKGGKTNC